MGRTQRAQPPKKLSVARPAPSVNASLQLLGPPSIHSEGQSRNEEHNAANKAAILEEQFRQIQGDLIRMIGADDIAGLKDVHSRLATFVSQMCSLLDSALLAAGLLRFAADISRSIHVICSAVTDYERQMHLTLAGAVENYRARLGLGSENALESLTSAPIEFTYFETVSYDPWRQWFLDHLEHPYPEVKDKQWLLSQVPQSLDKSQLSTWFTNARRRSGWTQLWDLHCDKDLGTMSALVQAARSPELLWTITPKTLEHLRKVIHYFEHGGRDKVAPWMEDAIELGKASCKTRDQLVPPDCWIQPHVSMAEVEAVPAPVVSTAE